MPIGKPVIAPWDTIRLMAVQQQIPIAQLAVDFDIRLDTLRKRAQRENWGVSQYRRPNSSKSIREAALSARDLAQLRETEAKLNLAVSIANAARAAARLTPAKALKHARDIKVITDSAIDLFNWNESKDVNGVGFNLRLLRLKPDELERLASHEVRELQDAETDSLSTTDLSNPLGTPDASAEHLPDSPGDSSG